ncbi:MAG TPA: hypothetical protein VF221_19960 [Chloroflexota bacterium]
MRVAVALVRLQLLVILRAGVKSGRPRPSLRNSGRQLYVLAILAFFAWQAYRLAVTWVSENDAARGVVFVLFQPALTSIGSAAVLIIFFYAFTSLIGTLTDKGDLRLLLLAPVRPELVLGEKLLLTSLGFSGALLLVLPACYAVGSTVDVSPSYYIAVAAAILLLPVAPVSLGALILMGLLRQLPPARARTISTIVGTLLGIAFFAATQTARFSSGTTVPVLPAWLPSTWPGRFVAAVGLGDHADAVRYGLLTLAIAAALFVLAVLAAARVLAIGAAGYGEVSRGHRSRGPARPETVSRETPASSGYAIAVGGADVIRPVWWTILTRDVLTLRRDPQLLVAFLYPLLILGFNAYGIVSRGSGGRTSTAGGTTLVLLIIATLLLVNTTVPSLINREGKAIILLALAPLRTIDILAAKWIVAAVPPIVIVDVAAIGLCGYLGFPVNELVLIALSLAALVVAQSGATLAANIAWPKLDSTNPRRQASITGSIVGLLADTAIAVFFGAAIFLSLYTLHGLSAGLAAAVLFAGMGVVSAACGKVNAVLLRRLLYREDAPL